MRKTAPRKPGNLGFQERRTLPISQPCQRSSAVFGQNQFQVRTDRSLVDVAYRLLDAAAILCATLAATRYTDDEHLPNLIVVGASTLLVHMVAVEVSGLYRSWRGSRLVLLLWCVLIN